MQSFEQNVDPKILGYTQALKAFAEETKKSFDLIKNERMPVEYGKQQACQSLIERMNGIIEEIRKEMDAGNISGAEAMVRRDLIVRAKKIIDDYGVTAKNEYVMVKGETRALQHQIDTITKLLTMKLAEEQRKLRVVAEAKPAEDIQPITSVSTSLLPIESAPVEQPVEPVHESKNEVPVQEVVEPVGENVVQLPRKRQRVLAVPKGD